MAVVGQTSANSCGAACLLCAAEELQKAPSAATVASLTPNLMLHQLVTLGSPFGISNQWLNAIYEVSANGGQDYSMPSGMIRAAQALGMTPTVITAQTNSMTFLNRQYPHEMQACQPYIVPVAASRLGNLTLRANERAIHCVRVAHGVHWVLQRDDNSYMDPAGGTTPMHVNQGGATLADRGTLKATGQSVGPVRIGYHGTGLAIKLS